MHYHLWYVRATTNDFWGLSLDQAQQEEYGLSVTTTLEVAYKEEGFIVAHEFVGSAHDLLLWTCGGLSWVCIWQNKGIDLNVRMQKKRGRNWGPTVSFSGTVPMT